MAAALKHTSVEETLLAALPDGEVADRLRARGLPNRRVEGWRWSDLRAALRSEKQISGNFDGDIPASPIELDSACTLVFGNGRLLSAPDTFPAGVSLKQDKPYAIGMSGLLGDLAVQLTSEPQTLCIEQSLDGPVAMRFLSNGNGIHQHHVQIHIGKGVSASIIETHEVSGAPFINGLTEYFVAPNASINRLVYQPACPDASMVQSTLGLLMKDSGFAQTILGFGGHYVRYDTRVQQGGDRAKTDLNTAYLLSGKNHFDTTSLVEHAKLHGHTDQLTKGIVREQGRAVFQGKFHVARGAQKTAADMQHKALLLTEEGEVNARPELEIYADDVECAHGNSIGALDEQAIFYMRQRGLTEAQARAMLVEAFVGEVLEKIDGDKLRDQFAEQVRAFMGGQA